jgi:hypothetical protein
LIAATSSLDAPGGNTDGVCAGAAGAASTVTCLLCSCSASGTLKSSVCRGAGGAGGGGTEISTSNEVEGVGSVGFGSLAANFFLSFCPFQMTEIGLSMQFSSNYNMAIQMATQLQVKRE